MVEMEMRQIQAPVTESNKLDRQLSERLTNRKLLEDAPLQISNIISRCNYRGERSNSSLA